MNTPQLDIQTTRGIFGLQIIKPVQELEQPRATLTQRQPAAILEMSTTRSRLSVDTTEIRADMNLKSTVRSLEEYAQLGKQSVLEGMARRAQEGQQLLRIENGGNAFKEIAKQTTSPPPAPIGIRFIANRSQIQMSIQPGTLNIKATSQKAINDVQINKPIHHYTPGKITGQMEQWHSIQIDVRW